MGSVDIQPAYAETNVRLGSSYVHVLSHFLIIPQLFITFRRRR